MAMVPISRAQKVASIKVHFWKKKLVALGIRTTRQLYVVIASSVPRRLSCMFCGFRGMLLEFSPLNPLQREKCLPH